MGLSSVHNTLLNITAQRADIIFQGNLMNRDRIFLAQESADLFDQQANLDPDSSAFKSLDVKIEAVHQADKKLELEIRSLDALEEALKTQQETLKKTEEQLEKTTYQGLFA